MMKRMWLALIALAWAPGCSIPDDPNYSTLEHGVRELPPNVFLDAQKWAANRRTADWFADRPRDEVVFTARCGQAEPTNQPISKHKYTFTVADVLRCLDMSSGADMGNLSFFQCVLRMTNDAQAQWGSDTGLGEEAECWHVLEGDYATMAVPKEWEPQKQTSKDVSREIVQSPTIPGWMIPLIVVVGTVAVFSGRLDLLPALCTLQAGTGSACPGNPGYPPGQTPQPDGTP